tara:strand:+ start:270 stop:578 length:309 start_codon:yes stop_codon:yes gene_type:complete
VISLSLPWILSGVLFLLLCVSLYYNYRFATIILKIEDSLEVSLNKLDIRYASISKILEIPLFYDSPQIRQVIDDIRASRDSILEVANQIAKIEETSDEEENR